MSLYQIKYRSVDPKSGYSGRDQQYSHSFALQRAEVEERWPVVRLVLVFNFPLLILQVQDGSALRMVQGRASIKRAQDERQENYARHCLKAQAPTDFAKVQRQSMKSNVCGFARCSCNENASVSLPDHSFYESRHDSDAKATSGHDENLDQFSSPLEILRHH